MMNKIPSETSIGRVYLTVGDLERSLDYYEGNIGLRRQERENGTARLGAGDQTLLVLQEQKGARPVRGTTGLYHFALRVPSRRELARTLHHLSETQTPVGGFSDHAVSEAIYLTDPDGHGIEIYRDRPREQWEYPGGNLKMTVDPFDMTGVLGELGENPEPWDGVHPQTDMGHIHLHVAHIPAAEQFYSDILGFDIMARYGAAASFVAAGGYHHHIGLNTWAGVGAPPPPPTATRLVQYEIRLPTMDALRVTAERLRAADHVPSERDGGFYVEDPSGNGILLTTA